MCMKLLHRDLNPDPYPPPYLTNTYTCRVIIALRLRGDNSKILFIHIEMIILNFITPLIKVKLHIWYFTFDICFIIICILFLKQKQNKKTFVYFKIFHFSLNNFENILIRSTSSFDKWKLVETIIYMRWESLTSCWLLNNYFKMTIVSLFSYATSLFSINQMTI